MEDVGSTPTCQVCNAILEGRRADAKTCSNRCRQSLSRSRRLLPNTRRKLGPIVGGHTTAAKADLYKVGNDLLMPEGSGEAKWTSRAPSSAHHVAPAGETWIDVDPDTGAPPGLSFDPAWRHATVIRWQKNVRWIPPDRDGVVNWWSSDYDRAAELRDAFAVDGTKPEPAPIGNFTYAITHGVCHAGWEKGTPVTNDETLARIENLELALREAMLSIVETAQRIADRLPEADRFQKAVDDLLADVAAKGRR